jgi:hypothetical protein
VSIGQALARARQQAGLTVADVSQRTRIREGIIRGIEADDFSTCGGDFYARGNIRSIAKVVDTDPAPLVAEYDRVWRDRGGSTDMTHVMDLINESRAAPAAEADTGPLGPPVPGPLTKPGTSPWAEPDASPQPEPGAAPLGGSGGETGAGTGTGAPGEPGTAPLGGSGSGWRTQGPARRRPPGASRRRRAARPGSGRSSGAAPWRAPGNGLARHRLNWTAVLAVAVVVAFGFIGYELLSSSGGSPPPAAASPASSRAAAQHPAEHGSGTPVPRPSPHTSGPPATPPAAASRPVTPVSAVAFGPGGAGQGDNPDLAHLAVDGSAGSAWHTDWYTSANFGNLYSGTGLLVDLGHPATITGVRISLGSAPGAALELRAGPSPSALRTVASENGVSGLLNLRLNKPVSGRYVLIWFTRLPDDAGTYEASVHDVRVIVRG